MGTELARIYSVANQPDLGVKTSLAPRMTILSVLYIALTPRSDLGNISSQAWPTIHSIGIWLQGILLVTALKHFLGVFRPRV
eukprot:scaffold4552_cov161-Amphora_coffeaeformis.AAC.5